MKKKVFVILTTILVVLFFLVFIAVKKETYIGILLWSNKFVFDSPECNGPDGRFGVGCSTESKAYSQRCILFMCEKHEISSPNLMRH